MRKAEIREAGMDAHEEAAQRVIDEVRARVIQRECTHPRSWDVTEPGGPELRMCKSCGAILSGDSLGR